MPQIPSTQQLFANFPKGSGEAVTAEIGGTVQAKFADENNKAYKSDCCIRVSRALNYGGDPIPAAGGGLSNPFMADKVIRTDKGGDGMWYISSTLDVRAYLTGRYGQPKVFPGNSKKSDLANIKGIIGFGFFHLDIWNGTTCAYHEGGFMTKDLKEMLVWEAA